MVSKLDGGWILGYNIIRYISNYIYILFFLKEIPMLNPFINNPSDRSKKHFGTESEESILGQFAHPVANSSRPGRWALWIGSLLSRMGKKPAKGNLVTKRSHSHV